MMDTKKSADSKTGNGNTPTTICDRIYELRKKKGMSQQALADLLYIDKSVVCKWENGRFPKEDKIEELAEVFKVSVTYLMYGRTNEVADGYLDLNGLTFYQIKLVKELVEELRKCC